VYRSLVILGVAARLFGQSAEEIAARSIEAMGGTAKFASINAIRVQGRMRAGAAGTFAPFSMTARRPGMYRMELSIGSDHVIQAYDGAIGWQSVTGEHQQKPTILTGDSLAHLIDQATNAIGGPLLDLAARHNQLELLGRESVAGADCYKLKVTLGTGNTMLLFIDSANYREIQEELPIQVNGQPSTIQQSVGEYRRFGPILMASLFVTRVKGGEDSQRLEIDSVEMNPTIDPALFKLPGSTAGSH
jgi:hypothetical protein